MTEKFLVTDESRRLARWLRLLGYDAVLAGAGTQSQSLSTLYRRAYNETRIVVTRNRRVRASQLFQVLHLISTERDAQLRQIVRTLHLPKDDRRWFSRCDQCNVLVTPIEKSAIKDRVPPYVYRTVDRFKTRESCQRIYWAATHWERAREVLNRMFQNSTN